MCLLFETIRVNDKMAENPGYHQARMDHSRRELFGDAMAINLNEVIRNSDIPGVGLYKCRIVYNKEIHNVEFVPYQPRMIRNLKMVLADGIIYNHKFLDRRSFEKLKHENTDADELVIVRKGLITDTTFSNIALFDGKNWYTPASYLLKGTRRQSLIESGKIIPAEITINDISRYQRISLINAMLDLGDIILDIDKISNIN
jgi:4-amino-4-deoxychorismate lyase